MRIGQVFWNKNNFEFEYYKNCFNILLHHMKIHHIDVICEFIHLFCECDNFEDIEYELEDMQKYIKQKPEKSRTLVPVYNVKFVGYEILFQQREQILMEFPIAYNAYSSKTIVSELITTQPMETPKGISPYYNFK